MDMVLKSGWRLATAHAASVRRCVSSRDAVFCFLNVRQCDAAALQKAGDVAVRVHRPRCAVQQLGAYFPFNAGHRFADGRRAQAALPRR